MIKIFVYGTLKRGQPNYYGYLRDSKFICDDSISGFEMFDLGYFPGIKPTEDKSKKVFGEVFEVAPKEKLDIDLLEGTPFLYTCNKVTTDKGHKCFVYVYDRFVDSKNIIEKGKW